MSGLVTCDMLGSALIQWLNNATELQKDELCTALGCNDGALDNLLSQLRDCQGASLEGKRDLATCDDLAQATELNQGTDLPSDASDCDRPLSACGLSNILNGEDLNPLQQAVFKSWLNNYVNDEDARNIFLSTLISSESGNRIEVRGDGIGVWDEAPPNLATQYVDAIMGDDGNAGSQESPLRTIYQALSNIQQNSGGYGTFSILLHTGQEHVLNRSLPDNPNASLMFSTYADPEFGRLDQVPDSACPMYRPYWMARVQRAVIRWDMFNADIDQPLLGLDIPRIGGKSVSFVAVSLKRMGPAKTYRAGGDYMIDGDVYFDGATVEMDNGPLVNPSSEVSIRFTHFTLGDSATVVDGGGGASIRDVAETLDDMECAGWPDEPVLVGNTRTAITLSNLGLAYDAPTKTLFGGSTSWDIFA